MEPVSLRADIAASPFVASWLPRAYEGDLFNSDQERRASAWAHWALTSMTPMQGAADRPYLALALPGAFHNAPGTGPKSAPHLEVPAGAFERADSQFPDRLAQVGNALLFPWWVVPEVLAAKRALFSSQGDVGPLLQVLAEQHRQLVEAVTALSAEAEAAWSDLGVPGVDASALTRAASDPFDTVEVVEFFPYAASHQLRVTYDSKAAQSAGDRAPFRLGVWRISGHTDKAFGLGVVTPRLTHTHLTDPLFTPSRDSGSALLVRGLVLRRLLRECFGRSDLPVVAASSRAPASSRGLRAIVARAGEKLPEASPVAATHFVHAHPDADQAWSALAAWALAPVGKGRSPRAVLTVTAPLHRAAHASVLRALEAGHPPSRPDIDVLLPIAWDHRSRVVRVTFSSPRTGAAVR